MSSNSLNTGIVFLKVSKRKQQHLLTLTLFALHYACTVIVSTKPLNKALDGAVENSLLHIPAVYLH